MNSNNPTPPTTGHHPRARSQRPRTRRIFRLASRREISRVSRFLRRELIGGFIIIAAALLGFILANSPLAESFFALRETKLGSDVFGLHLNLDLGHWAADGLLAIFFFVVGLELKHEFVKGELSKLSTAIVPVAAAFGGVAVPALIYFAFNAGTSASHGWAIPTATDIAFAVAILGLVAPRIHPAIRMFLLTLAVVDDLIAITIIALFYTTSVNFTALLLSLIPIALFGFLAQKFPAFFAKKAWSAWVILLPIGFVAWALFLESGIHATIAGVLLAFTVPVKAKMPGKVHLHAIGKGRINVAESFAFRFQPLSSGFAVPVFAFFSAGVAVGGNSNFPFDPIAYGVIAGLVLGKPIGITLTTWLVTRFTNASIDPSVKWKQIIGMAALAGVGFTVSLLITELTFKGADRDTASLAVMSGSLIAVLIGSVLLFEPKRRRDGHRVFTESIDTV